MRNPTLLLGLLLLAACSDSSGTSVQQIQAEQTRWHGHFIRDYQYLYAQTGFNTALSNRTFRVIVLGDTVRAVNDTVTGDSIPVAWDAVPTVDGLFDAARAGVGNGSVTSITFDPSLGYPRRIDFTGPPDVGGSIFASNLQPLLTAAPPHR